MQTQPCAVACFKTCVAWAWVRSRAWGFGPRFPGPAWSGLRTHTSLGPGFGLGPCKACSESCLHAGLALHIAGTFAYECFKY